MSKQVNKKAQTQGIVLVLISSFFYGTYGVWSRLMGDSFGAYSQAAIKCLLVVLFLLPIGIYQRNIQKISLRDNSKWVIVSFLSGALTSAPIYYAMNTIGISLSLVVFYAAFLVSMQVFDYVQEKRLPFSQELLVIVLAIIGVTLVYSPDSGQLFSLGFIAALASGFGTGTNVLSSQKINANSTTTTLISWTAGILINIPIALFLHNKVPAISDFKPWLYIILFAIFSLASSWTVIKGVKIIKTGLAGLIGLMEVVFGALFGIVLFSEVLSVQFVIGAALIMIAATIPSLSELIDTKKLLKWNHDKK